ncbi:hypothetical protein BDV33DRAFT_210776 [Aspergillus novoparasiticus]|uniref:Uncharacterized protein n=1 Tax=Aspergillus novoparasiticus TaxID=986946 RepID=A0A5N6E6V4_9EURO|nr:hypothetical protein BDV33DRAFT_210776 [Aspergillus novoparasiticus]
MDEDSVFLLSALVQGLALYNMRIQKALPQLMPSTYYLEAAVQPTITKLPTDRTETKTVHRPQTTCLLGNPNHLYELYGYYSAEASFGLWHNRDEFYHHLRAVAPAAIFGVLSSIDGSLAPTAVSWRLPSPQDRNLATAEVEGRLQVSNPRNVVH